jgi:hypothetical protein
MFKVETNGRFVVVCSDYGISHEVTSGEFGTLEAALNHAREKAECNGEDYAVLRAVRLVKVVKTTKIVEETI